MTDREPPTPSPALRASDADRERVVELLRDAAGDGRLDIAELDVRVSAAYATRTLTELAGLTQDLVPRAATAATSPASDGTRRIISIMGGHDRRGRWRVAARCLVLSIMGGADLDLCDAELSAPLTTMRVISIMGGCRIRVPSGVEVRVERFALMGGHDVTLDAEPPPPGAPVIRLQMLAVMGGAEVRQGRGPSAEHRLRRGRD